MQNDAHIKENFVIKDSTFYNKSEIIRKYYFTLINLRKQCRMPNLNVKV